MSIVFYFDKPDRQIMEFYEVLHIKYHQTIYIVFRPNQFDFKDKTRQWPVRLKNISCWFLIQFKLVSLLIKDIVFYP